MPKITDPDALAQTTDVIFNTGTLKIEVKSTGAISGTGASRSNGLTMQCLYSFAKEEWRTDNNLVKFPFPFVSITAESFELVNGWDFLNNSSRNLIRDAGWALKDGAGLSQEEYMNVSTLGDFSSGSDNAYYQQQTSGSTTQAVSAGEVNQPIKIYGDVTHGNFNYRAYFKLFLREQGKVYDSYDLLTAQGLSSVTYKKYALPLSNSTDLKIAASDVSIDANSDGVPDVLPYSDINITYLAGVGFTNWTVATVYGANAVVKSAAGRWFRTVAGGTSAGNSTNLAGGSDTGVTWVVFTGERLIGATYYVFNKIVDANVDGLLANPAAEKIYELVQFQLRQNLDIDAGSGTVTGKTAEELLKFIGDTLQTKTGVYIDDFHSTDTNRLEFTDVSGTGRTFPFVAAGTLLFNDNLVNDASAVYRVFFTNDDAGTNTGRDFGTATAIILNNNSAVPISGNVAAATSIAFDYDYDNNIQRGAGSGGTDVPYTAVALGLNTAQYVVTTGTIVRSTANSINYVASLERNYLNV